MPTKDLHFPTAGVNRRLSVRSAGERRETYPTPWGVNVRVEDNLDRRMRGGSRQGLTRFAAKLGTDISDLVSINVRRTGHGPSAIVVALVDSTIKTIEDGAVVASAAAPEAGFLVTGQQFVYAVTTAGVTKIDPKTGVVATLAESTGTVPTVCTFGAVYRDRLCLAGRDNGIYMSRQGNYTDWDYGQHVNDQGRAIVFQLSLGADVGEYPTAMIPNRDGAMICATARSLWVLSGDPTTGQLQRISEDVGIVGPKAWCRIDDQIAFLADDGLYMMQADGTNLRELSPEAVPDELRIIDPETTTVSIGYESDRRAFHI